MLLTGNVDGRRTEAAAKQRIVKPLRDHWPHANRNGISKLDPKAMAAPYLEPFLNSGVPLTWCFPGQVHSNVLQGPYYRFYPDSQVLALPLPSRRPH